MDEASFEKAIKLMAVSLSKSSIRRISEDFTLEVEEILALRAKKKVNKLYKIASISNEFSNLWELGLKLTESMKEGPFSHVHEEVEKELEKLRKQ